MGAEDLDALLHHLGGHRLPPPRTCFHMAVPAFQVAPVADVDLEHVDGGCPHLARNLLVEPWCDPGGIHSHISFFLMIFRICVAWASTTPATIAAPTWTASIISSLDTPKDKHRSV